MKMGALGFLTAGGTAGAYFSKVDTSLLELTQLEIKIRALPSEFEGYRIGFLSDIHLGPFVSNELVRESVNQFNHKKIDLLLLGGDHINLPMVSEKRCFWFVRNPDFADAGDKRLIHRIYDTLGGMLSETKTTDGICSVYGNHDRWFAPRTCAELFKRHHIALLVNNALIVRRSFSELRIVGVDDYWGGFPSLAKETPHKAPGQVRILLAHNPDYIAKVLDRTDFEFDLGLAGHTHGGQIRLPLLSPLLFNISDHRFNAGLFRHKRAPVYTTRGIGTVEFPVRVNCPPEACIFTLRSAA